MERSTPIIVNTPKTNDTFKYVGLAVSIAGLYFGYTKYKDWKEQQDLKNQLNKDQASTIVSTPTKPMFNLKGQKITSANLATIASDIYAGLHPGWYKPTDQERCVRAFLNCPFGYVKDLEKIYLEKYSENLKDTLLDKLSDTNWIKIKYWFK